MVVAPCMTKTLEITRLNQGANNRAGTGVTQCLLTENDSQTNQEYTKTKQTKGISLKLQK